jgi:hypothetical protein
MDVSDASYYIQEKIMKIKVAHQKKRLKSGFQLQWKLLYVTAFEQGETDNFNQMIILTKQALRLVDCLNVIWASDTFN